MHNVSAGDVRRVGGRELREVGEGGGGGEGE